MAAKFPIDQSVLPHLRTRKALLVLDLQNDFLRLDGALALEEPEELIKETLDVVKAFRQSGAGEVIWVRSEFQEHRPAGGDQVVVSDSAILPSRSAYSRGRRRTSDPPPDEADGDDEAFLSAGNADKPKCVRPGTPGSELVSEVLAVVEESGDMVLTKSHYSAFDSTQLLMRLRTRLATELYICGALTNISIFATAVDAGRHGLAVTLVEDCCGRRSGVRHHNALQKLAQLVGSETTTGAELIATLSPKASARISAPDRKGPVPRKVGSSPLRPGDGNSGGGGGRSLPVRNKIQSLEEEVSSSSKPGSAPPSSELKAAAPSHVASSKQPLVSPSVQPLVAADAPSPAPLPVLDGPAAAPSAKPVLPDSTAAPAQRSGDADGKSELPAAAKQARDGEKGVNPKDAARSSSKGKAEQLKQRVGDAASTGAKNTNPHATPTGTPVVEKPSKQPALDSSNPKSGDARQQSADPSDITTTGDHDRDEDTSDDEDATIAKMKVSPKQPTASEPLCEGDTIIYHNVLQPSIEEGMFERLRDEVSWMRMSHQGGEVPRLVCVQGAIDKDGSMPVYRHPADESPPLLPFSPSVVEIKGEIEELIGHPLNHVLIQFYRSGNDYISEHSDKTLDIVKDSYICNVSLGAERTMVFRTKRVDKDPSRKTADAEVKAETAREAKEAPAAPSSNDSKKRQTVRAQLPHNSLCRMGLKTNMRWLHAIRQDKRADRDKTEAELAFAGGRISLTFRHIGTFLNSNNTLIWGQGGTVKEQKDARPVVNGQTPEAVKMLQCFGRENQSSDFDWGETYGGGFDVLHISNAPRFFSSSDPVVNMRIQLMLAEYGIAFAKGSMGPARATRHDQEGGAASADDVAVKFIDNDAEHSTVEGQLAIMLYLDALHGAAQYQQAGHLLAKRLTRFQRAIALLDKWRGVAACAAAADHNTAVKEEEAADEKAKKPEEKKQKKRKNPLRPLASELLLWDGYASETEDDFIAGGEDATLADFALWPVLHDMERACGGQDAFVSDLAGLGCEDLVKYYKVLKGRRCVMHVLKTQGGASS
ncbi:uncharacterized protein E0L32_003846 [Thyridium curvatum]|uniref:Fe2OG dioxygenase domain-containing protein n=1 Tax=Thyridium curvatum TaxID=1093900 RepID=A0A507B2Q2_9PEZI|nr:uncharacterized protein E0L32_003846 [Thyridium curvatum]TPX16552.1 hypothetical protein E0L32_003846 [Thyridium curvatum]